MVARADIAVRVDGASHRFRSGRVGLSDVSLTVRPGERVAVLGRNGSGKTTLLRVLSTALAPDAGRVELLGVAVPPATPALRRRLGVASDRPAHLDALDGRANARIFARAAGVSAVEAGGGIAGLFERFRLTEAADVAVADYSLGMRRKLLLIEALLHDPELLLFDEPTLGLDAGAVDALVEETRARAARGDAVVMALNDVAAAARMADRVLFLDGGRVVADAPPDELVADLDVRTVCTVEVAPEDRGRPTPEVDGVRVLRSDDGLQALLDRGAAALPDLVGALVAGGFTVRSLNVHEPDLGDAFRALTGRSLEAPTDR